MRAAVPLLLLLLPFAACLDRVEIGANPLVSSGAAGETGGSGTLGGTAGMPGGAAGVSATGGSAGVAGSAACQRTACRNTVYACGNCEDDDGDGLVDSQDPECLGPCDDVESSFFGGVTRGSGCRLDCYFDRNSGGGNDRCSWNHSCDPLSLAPDFPPSGDAACRYEPTTTLGDQTCDEARENMSATCREACVPLTPNGCDCFGCCQLPARTGRFVWLGSQEAGMGTCDATRADDPSACRPCTPVPSCFNECEACEVCVGGAAERDPSCPGSEPACEGTLGPCSANASCPSGAYCITGCCVAVPR